MQWSFVRWCSIRYLLIFCPESPAVCLWHYYKSMWCLLYHVYCTFMFLFSSLFCYGHLLIAISASSWSWSLLSQWQIQIHLPGYLAAAVTPDDWRPPSAHFFIVLLHADLFLCTAFGLHIAQSCPLSDVVKPWFLLSTSFPFSFNHAFYNL